MKNPLTEEIISTIIAAAWDDHVSFEKIKKDTGLTESEVVAVMRRGLKRKSFILWRKRVSGRKSKHQKKTALLAGEVD